MDSSPKAPTPNAPATPEAALRIARTVIGALVMGPLLFWAVAWVITEGGTRPLGVANAEFRPAHALMIWAVLAVGGFAGAMMFRRKAVELVEEGRRGQGGVFAHAGSVQGFLIVAMALLEGPALFAGVMFLLFGARELLMYAAPLFLVGVALTFPRAEWFGADGRR